MNEKVAGINGGHPEFRRQHIHTILSQFMAQESISARKVAKVIGCSEATVLRIINDVTWPTDEMMKRCHTMIEIGYKRYSKLSEAEKEKISNAIGTVGGGVLGVGVSLGAVSALGTVAGFSAAGMTSGLAALGAVVGGGMAAGIGVAAEVPLAIAGVGYGTVKLIKGMVSEVNLNVENLNPRWEMQKALPNDDT